MLKLPPDADSRCQQLKVDNLAGMARNYRNAGAQVLVMSGVIDPEHGHDFAEAAVEADVAFCHPTVDEPTLRDTQELLECFAGDVTIIIGPRVVGKSSVSWGMAMRRWVRGERTVYVRLDQVGFLRLAPPAAWPQAANLGGLDARFGDVDRRPGHQLHTHVS